MCKSSAAIFHFFSSQGVDAFTPLIVLATWDFQQKKHFSSSDFLLPTLHMKQWAALTPEVKHNYPSLSNGRDNIFSCSIFNKVTTTLFNLIVSIPFINTRQHLIMSFRQYNEDGRGQKKKTTTRFQKCWNNAVLLLLLPHISLSAHYGYMAI